MSRQVDRCFGMLVSPGRNVRHSDMQLLESVKMCQQQHHWAIQVRGTESLISRKYFLFLKLFKNINDQGSWDPREAAFAVLNQETGPDIQSVYMTVAADLVLNQVNIAGLHGRISSFKSRKKWQNLREKKTNTGLLTLWHIVTDTPMHIAHSCLWD